MTADKIRTLIIDDEEPARVLIKHYLKNFEAFNIIGECSNGFEGLKMIQEQTPDLIFLDVQMPKLTGFEMLELVDKMPLIIFSTAYDEFAIKAFEANALDYLLKPYSIERFKQALEKALDKKNHDNSPQNLKLEELRTEYHQNQGKLQRIVVKNGPKIKLIPVENVLYFEAEDDYIMIHTTEGKFLKNDTMKFYENNLDSKDFLRVHRSFIARTNLITQVELYGKETYIATLKNNAKIKVSADGYKGLREALGF